MSPSTIQTEADENTYAELLVSLDIESVVVSAGGFIARTKAGGSVSISQSESQELTITKVQSGARPPSYFGRGPRDPYLGLLGEIRALVLAKNEQKG